jgi:hypothetical protein
LRRVLDRLRALSADAHTYDIACDVAALGLTVVALLAATRVTDGLRWPFDPDHWRDIAQAQTIRDGHPLADPNYRGEWTWYNPLLASTLAAGSRLTRTTIAVFHVKAGPYLNLLGPVAFYVLARRLYRPPAALASLALLLFFMGNAEPFPLNAAYSPWLFTAYFGEGFFFLSTLALLWAWDRPTVGRSVLAGALSGATFLVHTAPAAILAAIAGVLFVGQWRRLVLIGLTALTVASPFLISIVGHYHLHLLNQAPILWPYSPVTLNGLSHTLRSNALLVAAALIGLVLAPNRALVAWLIASVAFMIEAVLPLPRFMPAFHFWLYLASTQMDASGSCRCCNAVALAGVRQSAGVCGRSAAGIGTRSELRSRVRLSATHSPAQ